MSFEPYAPPKSDSSRARPGVSIPTTAAWVTQEEAAEIERRLKTLNTRSIAFGAPGLLLQGAGGMLSSGQGPLLRVLGLALMVTGLTYYARMRGRSPWFGLLGALSCVGALVLSRLPKNCVRCNAAVGASPQCRACGAPVSS